MEAPDAGSSRNEADGTPLTRKSIGGFELLERLGQGGMGAVFKARQMSMDRIVALKILPRKLAKNRAFVERFIREARSAATLSHPNIVQGIDVGHDGGHYYFAMEFVDGVTVRSLIEREGRIEEKWALQIIAGVAVALEHAHEHGIVHRDIKPDNIMINREGDVKLADLGLARSTGKVDTVTVDGAALGTPHYMAPEQARGEHDIDTRADIYGLGATLYHMVTGARPFDGPTAAAIMAKAITEPFPSPKEKNPELSRGICELIEHMTCKERDDRPETPAELLQEIRDVLAGKIHLRPSRTARTRTMPAARVHRPPVRRPSPSSKAAWVLAACAAVVFVIIAMLLIPGGGRKQQPPRAVNVPPPKSSKSTEATGAADAEARAEAEKRARQFTTLRTQVLTLASKDKFGDALKFLVAFSRTHDLPEVERLKDEVHTLATRRYEGLVKAADAAVHQKDFAKGRAILAPVKGFGITELTEEAQAKLDEIDSREKDAQQWAKWDDIKARATKLTEAGKLDEAVKTIKEAEGLTLPTMAKLIAEQADAIDAARRAVAERVIMEYGEQSDGVWALYKERKYAEADKLLTELAEKYADGAVGDHLSADQEASRLLKGFWSAVERGVLTRLGKFVSIGGASGEVLSVVDGKVALKTVAGESKHRLHEFTAKQGLAYAEMADEPPSALALAVFLLAEQMDLPRLPELLGSASRSLPAAVYEQRLNALLAGGRGRLCVYLADIPHESARVGFGRLLKSTLLDGKVFERQGKQYHSFIDAHAPSRMVYLIPARATWFTALVGCRPGAGLRPTCSFIAKVDGQLLTTVKCPLRSAPLTPIRVQVDGKAKLELIIDAMGSRDFDHSCWVEPRFWFAADAAAKKAREAREAGGWVGLFDGKTLKGWREVTEGAFANHGKAIVRGNCLYLEKGRDRTGVVCTQKLPTLEYEVSFEVKRDAGPETDLCRVIFTVGESPCMLVIGHLLGGPGGIGLWYVDGKVRETPKTTFPQGKWHRIVLRVTAGKIEAWVDDLKVVDQDTAGRRLTLMEKYQPLSPFGLATWRATMAFRNIRFRRLKPQAAQPVHGQWKDLFDGKTLDGWRLARGRDVTPRGEVRVSSGVLSISCSDGLAGVESVHRLPTVDYEVALDAMVLKGTPRLCRIVFPIGSTKCVLAVGSGSGTAAGLHQVDGKDFMPGRRVDFMMKRWYSLRLRVTVDRIQTWIDGREVLSFSTERRRFTVHPTFVGIGPFGLVANGNHLALRNIRFRRLSKSP